MSNDSVMAHQADSYTTPHQNGRAQEAANTIYVSQSPTAKGRRFFCGKRHACCLHGELALREIQRHEFGVTAGLYSDV